MRKLVCDLCQKELTKEEGIRKIEVVKVSTKHFEDYPSSYDASSLYNLDICLKCFLNIEKEIIKIKKRGRL